jgi:hypothetical protein
MSRRIYVLAAAVLGALALTAAGCGDDGGSSEPTKVDVVFSGSGNATKVAVPSEIESGAATFAIDNSDGKVPHSGQVIRIDDGHTLDEALAIVGSDKPQVIPEWIRAYGGPGTANPGESSTATVKLDEGHYALFDDSSNGPPISTEFDVKGSGGADLPSTDLKITAAETGNADPQYEWQVGDLKAGDNTLTFDSEGDEALHLISAVPIKGDATIEDVQKELESGGSGGPPQTVDFDNSSDTAVIDGGKSEVTTLNLKPGRYALICFLPDRDEPNKPHFTEGLLKEVNVGG